MKMNVKYMIIKYMKFFSQGGWCHWRGQSGTFIASECSWTQSRKQKGIGLKIAYWLLKYIISHLSCFCSSKAYKSSEFSLTAKRLAPVGLFSLWFGVRRLAWGFLVLLPWRTDSQRGAHPSTPPSLHSIVGTYCATLLKMGCFLIEAVQMFFHEELGVGGCMWGRGGCEGGHQGC